MAFVGGFEGSWLFLVVLTFLVVPCGFWCLLRADVFLWFLVILGGSLRSVVVLGISLWFLVVLGFLDGSNG